MNPLEIWKITVPHSTSNCWMLEQFGAMCTFPIITIYITTILFEGVCVPSVTKMFENHSDKTMATC